MRLDDVQESSNVEDRRGRRGGGGIRGGGVVLALIALMLGASPRTVLRLLSGGSGERRPATTRSRPQEDERKRFVAKIVTTTEECWREVLRSQYREPTLVIFEDQVNSACGRAGASVGPFYCGEDEKMYIDLSFYDELRGRLGAPGDFAQGYVIAHEVGHHVQKVLGTLDKVHRAQARMGERESKALSVRLELQADFYAGIWGNYVQKRGLLEVGDVQEALQAASAIGDDRLQQMSRGYVVPDSFTHGSSEQRVRWFRRGLESGDIRQGDTFSERTL